MADYTPVYENGSLPYTLTASATVTGGQVVVHTGVGTCGPSAGASGLVLGIAAHDAATNARVSVWPIAGLVHETITPVGGVTSGDSLTSGTAGGIIGGNTLATVAAAGTLLGTAISTATVGLKARWVGK